MRKESLLYPVKAAIPIFALLFTTLITYSQPQIAYQPVITAGLTEPIEVVTAPGDNSGRLFIVQKWGVIRIWNGTTLLPTPFLDISSSITFVGEQGLLSMAFHPQYQINGFFYLYYNTAAGNVTVSRFQVTGSPATSNIADPTPNPATPLISIPKSFTNHNGGHLHFRNEAGINYMYFATGDGGGSNDPGNNAQNLSSLLGKMIRINVDAPTPTPEIWAWGLRNPFRWSFDRATGDMWIGDVGQGLREEVSYRAAGTYGANYGWPCFEGLLTNLSAPAAADCDTVDDVHIVPIFEYDNPPSGASSVIGGYVYRGTEFPSLQGIYMTADFYSGEVWLIEPAGPGAWTISNQVGLPANISSFSETNDGSTIYAVSLGLNSIYKVVVPIVTPLTLVNFSGRAGAGYNDLKWVAETESNIDRYIIEYSNDARTYAVAGEVLSFNNGNHNTYSYRHFITTSSKMYYRLKIVEQNGEINYSPVISIRGDDKLVAKVYPTIISNDVVNIIAGKPVTKIVLLGTDGRQVMAKDINGTDGYFTVPLPSLTKGIYFIRLSGDGFQQTEKIVVQ